MGTVTDCQTLKDSFCKWQVNGPRTVSVGLKSAQNSKGVTRLLPGSHVVMP